MTKTQNAPAARIYCTRCEAWGCTGTVGEDCPNCVACEDSKIRDCPACEGGGFNLDGTECRMCKTTGNTRCWRCR